MLFTGAIKWEYIEKLHELQNEEDICDTLRIPAGMLERTFGRAHCMSERVANALDYARDVQDLREFQGSKPTADFLRLIASVTDVLTSKSPGAGGFKVPISISTKHIWEPLFHETLSFLKELKLKKGKSVLMSKVKHGFLGLMCVMTTAMTLYEEIVVSGKIENLRMGYFSIEDLDLFFHRVRSQIGSHGNPTSREFESIFKWFMIQEDPDAIKNLMTAKNYRNKKTLTSDSAPSQSSNDPNPSQSSTGPTSQPSTEPSSSSGRIIVSSSDATDSTPQIPTDSTSSDLAPATTIDNQTLKYLLSLQEPLEF